MTNGECIYRKTVDYMFRVALEKDDFRRFLVICEIRVTGNWVVARIASKVENGPLTCNCRIKRGSENNSEINKFSQSTILLYYNRFSMHHCKKISFPDCRKMRFWETYLLKISRGSMPPDPPRGSGLRPSIFKGTCLL